MMLPHITKKMRGCRTSDFSTRTFLQIKSQLEAQFKSDMRGIADKEAQLKLCPLGASLHGAPASLGPRGLPDPRLKITELGDFRGPFSLIDAPGF